ncbi:MAG: ABC transporter ATP-binding protein, partial [Oscillospiraceae bacterium]
MLELKNIVKTYVTGDLKQDALKEVSISFRENEFVSILGQSGSGKTTMLNIIGGLDRYTSGDLIINGVSTKKYRDADWDFYRNNSIGFVFQSYNLIPHQSVLANVELALTLAGVSKKERRKRAIEVLKKVGLGDHIHKKPNQMSGGQMQRVAIARALINNPDILLADEPTGALDSETSIQIMELLKEIAKDKLVIMVTHNPELAEEYSTRIVKLKDGKIVGDTDPYDHNGESAEPKKRKRISMSFLTALSLSFNNLRTKKGRTLLTSFAGSIGIIGIALILSISTGIQAYVDSIQRDTLSSYPISVNRQESGITTLLSSRGEIMNDKERHELDAVYSNDRMYDMFNAAFTGEDIQNNLTAFKEWIDREMDPETSTTEMYKYVSDIQYQYDVPLNTYVRGTDGSYHSTDLMAALPSLGGSGSTMTSLLSTRLDTIDLWSELISDTDGGIISDMVYEQYDLVAGKFPAAANEVVLILDSNNEVSGVAVYALGMMSDEEVNDIFTAVAKQEEIEASTQRIAYEDVIGTQFKLVLNSDYYSKGTDGKWQDMRDDEASMELIIENGYDLNLVGILRPNPEAASASGGSSMFGTIGYTSALTDYVIEKTSESEIVKEQLLPENENYDVLTGLPFTITEEIDPTDSYKAEKITEYFGTLTDVQKTEIYTSIMSKPSAEYLEQTVNAYMQNFTTRESILDLAAGTYNFDRSAAEAYFEDYTDEELSDLLRTQLEKLVTEKYAEQAEMQIAQLKAAAAAPGDLFGASGYVAVAAEFDKMMSAITDENVLAGYYDEYMPATVSGSTLKDTLAALGSVKSETP